MLQCREGHNAEQSGQVKKALRVGYLLRGKYTKNCKAGQKTGNVNTISVLCKIIQITLTFSHFAILELEI